MLTSEKGKPYRFYDWVSAHQMGIDLIVLKNRLTFVNHDTVISQLSLATSHICKINNRILLAQ